VDGDGDWKEPNYENKSKNKGDDFFLSQLDLKQRKILILSFIVRKPGMGKLPGSVSEWKKKIRKMDH
jgi:hypothetical protein